MIYKQPYLTSLGKKPVIDRNTSEPLLRHKEKPEEIPIPDELRPQGLYIAGNPGYGKSSLIQNLVRRDIEHGYGVCVIDPSGDLISKKEATDAIIDWIPEKRLEDTIYFNTSESAKSIDFFSYHDQDERRVLLDELVAIFRLDNAPRAKPLLQKIISILFTANENEITPRCDFLDIQRFIDDKSRHDEILRAAKTTWPNFPKPYEFEAITTRIIPFTEDKILRKIVASANPEINIWDVMQTGKILLLDLQDTEIDHFIGSLIVAKIQQATFRRHILPKIERKLFFLYVDEFQAVIPASGDHFEKMLTRARKYNVCLTFANPLPDDLPSEIHRKLPSVATKILFNLDGTNASIFKDQLLPSVRMHGVVHEAKTHNYLNNLPKFSAICIRPHYPPTLIRTPKFLPPNPASFAERIKKRTIRPAPCDSSQVLQDECNAADQHTEDTDDFGVSQDKIKKGNSKRPG